MNLSRVPSSEVSCKDGSWMNMWWTEEEVRQMDEFGLKDSTFHATREERERYRQT